ncbi:MAG: acetoacetate decarboxylase family protein [Bacteroidales bacterium]|nr:acetoacetate decarboxylase family protein [Bacteroidales bacterium]
MIQNGNNQFSPPWQLSGEGLLLYYKFSPQFMEEKAFLPSQFMKSHYSSLGIIMLVNYYKSPVGAYRELLIAPGKFDLSGRRKYFVSKNYVDNRDAMKFGRKHWAMPKEYATFEWKSENDIHTVNVYDEKSTFFTMDFRCGSYSVPVSTSMFPIEVYQELNEAKLHFSPHGKGLGRTVRVIDGNTDTHKFPNVFSFKPKLSLYINPFSITFPAGRVK